MSVYSGFATRQLQLQYDYLLTQLIKALVKRILKFYDHEETNEASFKDILRKILTNLKVYQLLQQQMELFKYQDIKFTDITLELQEKLSLEILVKDTITSRINMTTSRVKNITQANYQKKDSGTYDASSPRASSNRNSRNNAQTLSKLSPIKQSESNHKINFNPPRFLSLETQLTPGLPINSARSQSKGIINTKEYQPNSMFTQSGLMVIKEKRKISKIMKKKQQEIQKKQDSPYNKDLVQVEVFKRRARREDGEQFSPIQPSQTEQNDSRFQVQSKPLMKVQSLDENQKIGRESTGMNTSD